MQIIDLHEDKSETLMDLYLKHADLFYAASISCDWDRFITPSAATPQSDASTSTHVSPPCSMHDAGH